MSQQSQIVLDEIEDIKADGYSDDCGILEFYCACDCCDVLMHKSTCGTGYEIMNDGQTLCIHCLGE